MAPSQLAQLKAALNTSGLSRQSKSKKTQNAKGRAGLTAKDREKKQKKLEQIKETLNRFDVREEKVKNPVVGKVQKSKTGGGLPSQSRQKGLEMVSSTWMHSGYRKLTIYCCDRDERLYSQSCSLEELVTLGPLSTAVSVKPTPPSHQKSEPSSDSPEPAKRAEGRGRNQCSI